MDPSQWMASFRQAHEKYKRNELNKAEKAKYLAMREELARSLVAAQSLSVAEGQNARTTFRVAQAFQIELSNLTRTLTREISRGGFGAIVSSSYKQGDRVPFVLNLGRGLEPISGEATVVAAVKQGSQVRANFMFERLSEAHAEILECALYDAVLARFK